LIERTYLAVEADFFTPFVASGGFAAEVSHETVARKSFNSDTEIASPIIT
jgi:hypothetical protein